MRRSRIHLIGYQCLCLAGAFVLSFLLMACDPNRSIKPATLDEINQDNRYPDPDSPGLFSGDKGYYELVGSSQDSANPEDKTTK